MAPVSLHVRTPAIAAAIILISHLCTIAQSGREKAVENPLSVAVYLLSKTAKDDKEEAKACLAKSLVRTNRIEYLEVIANSVEPGSYIDNEFISLAEQMIKDGREKEAFAFVSYLLKRFEGDDGYYLKSLVGPMILLKRDEELRTLIEKLDESEQMELWLNASESYRKTGKPERALAVLEKTVKAAMTSKYPNDRAELAFAYAKLGREAEAMELVQLVSRELDVKDRDVDVVHDIAAAYRALGKYREANEFNRVYDNGLNIDETGDIVNTASRLAVNGMRQKALDTLAQALTRLDPKQYGDSFNLGNIIEIYLQLGEVRKAEQVAMSVTGSDYMQQLQLLAVADRYAKAGDKTQAKRILRFALDQTKKIDTSRPENGRLWTSGKWDQARYQSQIAVRLISMGFDKAALAIISGLKKPYLKALILTEYVAVNRKRIHSKKLAPYLENALLLLNQKNTEIFDSKRFDVLAITARNFAAIGMPARANEVFAETLTKLDAEVIGRGTANGLIFAMCNIGVDFEKSQISAGEGVKAALLRIVQNWENDEY